MEADGHKVVALHGAFEGAERDKVIDDFRFGKAKVLITTNVLARGIDVQSVSMVVNYVSFIFHELLRLSPSHGIYLLIPLQDIPEDQFGKPDPQTYLHRIGRTGRFGRVGVSISFVHDKRSWEQVAFIQQYFGVEMTRLDTSDWDSVEKTIKQVIKSSRAGSNMKMS